MTNDFDPVYGFQWDQVTVQRWTSIRRKKTDLLTHKVIMVEAGGHQLEIYVSPTGRSVRVWKDHKEIK